MKILSCTENIRDPMKWTLFLGSKVALTDLKTDHHQHILTDTKVKNSRTPHDITYSLFPEPNYDDDLLKKLDKTSFTNIDKAFIAATAIKRRVSYIEYCHLYATFLDFYVTEIVSYSPDFATVWNGQVHPFQLAFVQACRMLNIPVIFLERGQVPESLFFDISGINFTSSLYLTPMNELEKENVSFGYQACLDHFNLNGASVLKEGIQQKELEHSDFIFAPMQRDTDSNLLFGAPRIANMYAFLTAIDKVANINKDKIIYRTHPEDPSNHYTKNIEYESLICGDHYSLQQTIEQASCIVTINSTIGFTSLLLQKSVICLGQALYSGKGFTTDYTEEFNELPDFIDEQRKAKKNSFNQSDFEIFCSNLYLKYSLSKTEDLELSKQQMNSFLSKINSLRDSLI